MEKVYELAEREDLDLIVLDTPPSQHALDFLEAPERLIGLLDSRLVQLLLHPALAAGRMGLRIFQRGLHQAFRLIERVSGLAFLEDISEFLLLIEGMSEGFRERAVKVRGLLFGAETGFVLAAGPADESVAHATRFLDRLEASKAPVRGLVVNRMRRWPERQVVRPTAEQRPAAEDALSGALAADGGPSLPARECAQAALAIVDGYAEMVACDARATASLRQRAGESGYFVRLVPEFPRDVHDLDGLAMLARLVCEDAEPEEGAPG
jgi:anion-transporting  ArsA/GET3 family ATPase